MVRCGTIRPRVPTRGSVRPGLMNAPASLTHMAAVSRASRAEGRLRDCARDSLQLHLVLRPRDRHPPARRAPGRCWNRLRQERRTGRSARMLYEVLGDIWVVQRNPTCRTTCSTTRRRASADRGAAPPARRHRARRSPEDAERDAAVGELLTAARRRWTASSASSARWPSCAARVHALGRVTA